jgi:hypothetical protein
VVVADVGRTRRSQNLSLAFETALDKVTMKKGGDICLARVDEGHNVGR